MLVTVIFSHRAGERGAGAERRLHGERGSPEYHHHHHHHYSDIGDIRPEHPGKEASSPSLLAAHTEVGGSRSVHLTAVLLINTEQRNKDNKTK